MTNAFNAVELTAEHENKYVRFTTVIASDYAAVKFAGELGDEINVTGRIVAVEKGIEMGRAWVRLTVEINGGWGTPDGFVSQFNLGSHRDVEIIDAPDADAEHKCIVKGCVHGATHVALDIDGETKVTVCTKHSHITRWWGVWPIENDPDFGGVNVGATGHPIQAKERELRDGEITRDDLAAFVDGYAQSPEVQVITLDKITRPARPTHAGLFSHA